VRNDVRGFALIDVVVTATLCLTMAAIAVPTIGGRMDREHTIIGARYLASQVHRARLEALKRGLAVALRIEIVDGRTSLQLYVDGNGNGVLQRDIDSGADPPLAPHEWLEEQTRVGLRIIQPVEDIGGGGALATGDDPLRIGRSSLVCFSPLGGSSSGTMYVAGQRGPQMAVRVYGSTGRVRVLMFDAQARQWRP
jgi:hypothetical protein